MNMFSVYAGSFLGIPTKCASQTRCEQVLNVIVRLTPSSTPTIFHLSSYDLKEVVCNNT